MVKPYPGEVPPPGGHDATPEQRAAAVERMLEDSQLFTGSTITAELKKLLQIPSDKSVIMDSNDIVK